MIRINVMTTYLRKLLSNRRFRERDIGKHSRRCQEYYLANAEKQRAAQRKYLSDPKNKDADYDRRYGKGASEHRRIQIARQNNRCAICKQPFIGRIPDLDHNHDTKQLRGVLCRYCNNGIGLLQDNPDILDSAALYLRDWRSKC